MPSAAANLARLTHAPDITLIYESGTLGTKPTCCRCRSATANWRDRADHGVGARDVPLLAAGRAHHVGFLGGAQIDRYANLNTTVIGPYDKPKVRLPGGGGAPEIAASCGEVLIIMAQGKRSFVEKLDFITSLGFSRAKLRLPGKGPTAVITDLGILTPDPVTKELTLTSVHPGVEVEKVVKATGWPLKVAAPVGTTEPPTAKELAVLRDLQARTAKAHAGQA
jgi:glutaconate CoA-transferase, subunit B